MDNNILNNLKKCMTLSNVEKLFNGIEYPSCDGSKLFESNVKIETRISSYVKRKIKLNQPVLRICLHVVLYLKFSGMLGAIPLRSGKQNFYTSLHKLLCDFEEIEDITTMNDITSQTIDNIIDKYRSKKKSLRPLINKMNVLELWIDAANELLPFFMNIDPSILQSEKYVLLKNDYTKERAEDSIGSNRAPYPLVDLKHILEKSIYYVENYSEEFIEVTEEYIKVSSQTKAKKYSNLYDYFCNTKRNFKYTALKKLQVECEESATKYKHKKGINKGFMVKTLISDIQNSIRICEASCVFIIMFLTGMRSQELYLLDRFPEISDDEYLGLKRLVYKTSNTKDGDVHEMPIPDIVKKALATLSLISSIKDGRKTGKIITPDLFFPDSTDIRTRINDLIGRISKKVNIYSPPTSHQLRHAMAFMIAYGSDEKGIELAQIFLKHHSIIMTLRYLGHYNPLIHAALEEMYDNQAEILVDKVASEIGKNNKLYGQQGKNIMKNIFFSGTYEENSVELFKSGLMGLIDQKQYAVIQTPVCLCIHDKSKIEVLECQRGLDFSDLETSFPITQKCVGERCSNSLFLEEDIKALESKYISPDEIIPDEQYKRLRENMYFTDGLEKFIYTDKKIISEYKIDKDIENGTIITRRA